MFLIKIEDNIRIVEEESVEVLKYLYEWIFIMNYKNVLKCLIFFLIVLIIVLWLL